MCKLYEKIYTIWPGYPWTQLLYEWWRKYEGVWIIGLVIVGAVASRYFGLANVIKALGVFAGGYIAGHIFWGKEGVSWRGRDD